MKRIIVDSKIPKKMERALEREDFYIIKLPSDPQLPEPISSHPDTVLFYAEGEMITTADYCDRAAYIFSDLREIMPSIKIRFTSEVRKAKYPYDCIMNALLIQNKLFCKSDTVSGAITELARQRGYEIIHTAQGYPACSTLAFGSMAITADRGLARILSENGVKTLIISEGSISLPPYEFGFIGGASGVVGRKIYFFGNLDLHPDAIAIKNAIQEEGYTAISLSEDMLLDLGGIISL